MNHSNVNSCNRSLSPSLGDKLLVVSITVKIEDGEYFRRGAQGDDLYRWFRTGFRSEW